MRTETTASTSSPFFAGLPGLFRITVFDLAMLP
jgi:hypothetical protein